MSIPATANGRSGSRLFLALFLLAAVVPLLLIADRRLPRNHQGREFYEQQYALLGGAAGAGAPPLWLPFTSHGVVSSPELFRHAGLLPSLLLLGGPVLAGRDFLGLFYLGMLAEELIFLLGCWCLARRFFSSPQTAFFIGVSALGSAFWLDEPWLNFRSAFALPLLLSLLHGFLDDGSRKKLILAGSLAAVQVLGSPPYLGLVSIGVPALYFLGRRWVLRRPLSAPGSDRRWKKSDAILLLGLLGLWIPVVLVATLGTATLEVAGAGSSPQLRDILAYSGLANPLRAADLLTGWTPSLDWSLYCGGFTIAFALVALLTLPRDIVGRLLLALPCGLLLLGLLLYLLFLIAPSLQPSRPAAVGVPFLRLLIIFVAGAGFEHARGRPERRPLVIAGTILSLGGLIIALIAASAALELPVVQEALRLLVAGEPRSSTASPFLEPAVLLDRVGTSATLNQLGASAFWAAVTGGVLFLWASRPRAVPLALTFVFLLHPLDLMSWKFRMSWMETFSANPEQSELQRIAAAPFVPRRSAAESSARWTRFHHASPDHRAPLYAPRPEGGSTEYWFADPARPEQSRLRMAPWSRLVEAGTLAESSPTPWNRPGLRRIAGIDTDRVQFYRAAHGMPDAELARRIALPEFSGSQLWIDGASDGSSIPASVDERLPLPFEVLAFDSNRLRVSVEAPAGGAWMFSAEAWAPCWKADVNGTPREIHRAFLGYKALRLDPGKNVVELRVHAPLRTFCSFLLGLQALFWLAWILRSLLRQGGTLE